MAKHSPLHSKASVLHVFLIVVLGTRRSTTVPYVSLNTTLLSCTARDLLLKRRVLEVRRKEDPTARKAPSQPTACHFLSRSCRVLESCSQLASHCENKSTNSRSLRFNISMASLVISIL
nr:hypothetical protein CFP56_46811 [Quercus suber]